VVQYRRQHSEGDALDPQVGTRPRKRRRGIAILPTMFTLGNCLCGFASIHYAARTQLSDAPGLPSNYAIAGYAIFGAMLFDMFDGFVARLTRSASDFGAELDSLADMVSFGIAPAFLSLRLIGDLLKKTNLPAGVPGLDYLPGPFSDDSWGRLFWLIGAIYVSCTALRLARFNVMNKHDVGSHMNFRGMPSPGAAAVVASSVIFLETLHSPNHVIWFNVSPQVSRVLQTVVPYLLPLVLLTAALLMVSRFPYSHLINRFLRGRKKFRQIVGFLFLFMLIFWQPQITTLVAIYVYALSSPVAWLWRVVFRKNRGAMAPGAAPARSAT
jgi:CDP-diacylglycerol--serine O-phosphatidyltransferase